MRKNLFLLHLFLQIFIYHLKIAVSLIRYLI